MTAKEIARGGVLAAAAVALLYLGAAMPYMAPAACIVAGTASAVPLLRRDRVRTAVLLYLAAGVLGPLLVPRKGVAAAYLLFCGLYPIVKFLIESRVPVHRQTALKLAYFNIMLPVAAALMVFVFAPGVAFSGLLRIVLLWAAADVLFLMYDVALSRLIAMLRRSLPPE